MERLVDVGRLEIRIGREDLLRRLARGEEAEEPRAGSASCSPSSRWSARGDHAAAQERFAAVRKLVPEMWPQIEASLRQKGFLLP